MLDIYMISARKSSDLNPDPTYLRTFRKELFCVETLWIVIVLLFPFLLLQVVVMSKSDICLMDESDKSLNVLKTSAVNQISHKRNLNV